MRALLTAFIILLTAAVGSVVYILQSEEYRHLLIEEEVKLEGASAFIFDPELVRKISITTNEGVTGEFVFEGNQWFANKPWNDRADNLGPLISFAVSSKIQKVIPEEEAAPSSFGIGEGSHHIQMLDAEGNILADFDFGLSSPWHVNIQDSEKKFPCVYLRRRTDGENAPTLLCSDPQFKTPELFKNELVRFRNYYLTNPFDMPFLKEISITRDGANISLSKVTDKTGAKKIDLKDSYWAITKPLEERADPKSIKGLITNLTYLSALEIISPTGITLPEEDESNIEIKLSYFTKEEPVILKIYPSTNKNNITLATISDRENVVFQIPTKATAVNQSTYQSLPANVNDVRAKNLLELDPQFINIITILPKGANPVRLRKLRNWDLVTAKQEIFPANKQALANFIQVLTEDTIIKFVSDAPSDLAQYSLEDPRLKIYLVDIYNNPQAIYLGNAVEFEQNGVKQIGVYAKSATKDSVWIVDTKVISQMKTQEWAWKPLEIFDIGISSVRNIVRKRSNKITQFVDFDFGADRLHVYEGEDEDFQKNTEITHLIDATRAGFFIKTLTSLAAISRVDPDSKIANQALAQNACMTISLTYEDYSSGMPKRKELIFAPVGKLSTSKFFYVKDSQTGEIFDISRKTCEYLFDTIRYKK